MQPRVQVSVLVVVLSWVLLLAKWLATQLWVP